MALPAEPDEQPPSPLAEPRRRRWRRLVGLACVGYAASIVLVWAWMVWDGDRGWLATLILFGPRWICAIPLPALVLAAALVYRRMLLVLGATAVMIVGPVMGFQAHWPRASGGVPALRVMTANVNGDEFDKDALFELIEHERPDVVALQEVWGATQFRWPQGWHVLLHNEFLLASRFPLKEQEPFYRPARPKEFAAVRYVVSHPELGGVQVFNVHFETPRPGVEAMLNRHTGLNLAAAGRLEEVLAIRDVESREASRWVESFPGPKIIVGDFNTPGESTVFRRDWSAYADAFATAGWGLGFTKISEKRGWSYGARIDHVLVSHDWRCTRVWVGPDIGSDHLPLVADLDLRD